jgi:hypothetical protein
LQNPALDWNFTNDASTIAVELESIGGLAGSGVFQKLVGE